MTERHGISDDQEGDLLPPGTRRRQKVTRVGPDGQTFPFHAAFLVLPAQAITITDHVMGQYCIHYFLGGLGRYTDANGCDVPIRPGSLLQRIPGLVHSFDFASGQDVSLCSLSFAPQTFDVLSACGAARACRPHYPLRLERRIVDVFERLLERYQGASWEQLPFVVSEAIAAAMDLVRQGENLVQPAENALLDRARRLLETDPSRRLAMPEVASRLHMPYSTFRQWFRSRTGQAPGAYRLAFRLRRARELIADGRFALNEVAIRLGYPDYAGFARQFTKHVGQSPSQFALEHGPAEV